MKKMTKKFHFTRGFLRKYSLEQRKKETLGKKYNLFPHFLILNGGQNRDFLIYVLLRLANTRIRQNLEENGCQNRKNFI